MADGIRNWIGFWMVGASLNFGYNMMLTAAHDLLKPNNSSDEFCNPVSAGTFLVADTIGGVTGIAIAPLIPLGTGVKMFLVTVLSICSFATAAFSFSELASLAAVIMAAFAAGFGEVTILSLSLRHHKSVVSAYTSGLGASAILSSGAYLTTTSFLPLRTSLLTMIIVPLIMSFSFWLIVTKTNKTSSDDGASNIQCPQKELAVEVETTCNQEKGVRLLFLVPNTVLPLFTTSVIRAFVSQGLFELLFDRNIGLSSDVQYRVLNTVSNLGMFLSQSSVQVIQIRKLWFLPVFEASIMGLILFQVLTQVSNFYLMILLSFLGGLIGGAAIVNTYYRIRKESPSDLQASHMELAICANELGAAVAGFAAIPSHAAICSFLSPSASRPSVILTSSLSVYMYTKFVD